jgi:glycosyltransferase involved in cell wall biosynthesis
MDPSILWLASHFRHPSGYAEEARSFLRALEEAGHAPAARQLRRRRPHPTAHPRWNVELGPEAEALLNRQLRRWPRDPCVAVHHHLPRARRDPLPSKANVARTMFETDRLPDGWREHLLPLTEVWVPSRHNHGVFAAGGVEEDRLRIIGGTLDFDAFAPGIEPYPLDAPSGQFVFLANFDFSERKGWRQLVQAWARAFGPQDPVCLVLKTGSVALHDGEVVRGRIESFVRATFGRGWQSRLAPIRILAQMLPSPDLPRLYAAADAFVSRLSRRGMGAPLCRGDGPGAPDDRHALRGEPRLHEGRQQLAGRRRARSGPRLG